MKNKYLLEFDNHALKFDSATEVVACINNYAPENYTISIKSLEGYSRMIEQNGNNIEYDTFWKIPNAFKTLL